MSLCSICMEKNIDTVIVPCNHACMCRSCANRVLNTTGKCPICRKPIQRLVTIFLQGVSACEESKSASSSSNSSPSAAATPVPDYVWDYATKTLTINDNTSDHFRNRRDIEKVVIKDSVTTIDDWTFDGCSSLAFVTFPAGLQTIGVRAFEGCYNIVEVKMPRNLGPSTVTGWSSSMMLKGVRKKYIL